MNWSRIFAAVSGNVPLVTLTLGALAAGCLWACSAPHAAPRPPAAEPHVHAVLRASLDTSKTTQAAPAPPSGAATLYREALELRYASIRLKKEVEALTAEDRERPVVKRPAPFEAASRGTDRDLVNSSPAP